MAVQARGYYVDAPGAPLAARELAIPEPGAAEAIVEVLACGLCHTDLAFASGAVPTKHPLPLVLGHEVVGTVVAAGERARALAGRTVIVPAVLPCGSCEFCRAGRGNACPDQKMPGNDIHGGFATHLLVPASPLVPVDEYVSTRSDARDLSVVADAVSTAYRAVSRAGVTAGDAAFVVGGGGVGAFVVQIARALGARVAVCDVSRERLALLEAHGAERAFIVDGEARDLRKRFAALAREWGVPSLRLRIFECSGTPEGQTLAFSLLARGATLVQVGYTPAPVSVRLSNLMAFDATVHGTWGCPPEAYPDVLRLIADGRVAIRPFVDYAPMSSLNDLLAAMAAHRLSARMVLDPRA
ncbi:MAG TPA: 6-hydroxycyclohex-1-ene-1-carbonyl-CoA dehydrogenase [Vicinamibacterales bacterium]|nr:6-hydroxycyclohex-1-ene-1-carbonyl-CoA dehydrogenase [Vicinamibacterales bacterium]